MAEEVPRPFDDAPRTEWAGRWHQWRADRRVAAGLLACVAVAAGAAWLHAGAGAGASSSVPPPAASTSGASGTTAYVAATSTTRAVAAIVVDVVGAVRRAAVVHLPGGARVIDAINAAGGATADADLSRLNLAAPLTDGARVAVPRVGAPAPGVDPAAVSGAPDGTDPGVPSETAPVDLNTATAAQLDALPGVGPATAAAIISDREAHGPFRSVNDLGRVRGIGDAKLDALRKFVTV